MNTELLKTFLEVAKTRHFGRAAENLFITQAAVSGRIKQLETLLGASLFVRRRNNVELTLNGERLLPHADNILGAWQLALQDVGTPPDQPSRLAVGASQTIWETLLTDSLTTLANDYPGLQLDTESAAAPQLSRALLSKRLGAVVSVDPPHSDEIHTRRVGTLALHFTAGAGTATDGGDAAGFVHVDWGTAINVQQAKSMAHRAPVLRTASCRMALAFIRQQGGVALLPSLLTAPLVAHGELKLVGADPILQPLFLSCGDRTPQAERLGELLASRLSACQITALN